MTLRLPAHPITAKLYQQMPEGPPYYELIQGNLVLKNEPAGMLRRAENPVTVDFYEKLPEGPPYYELIEGNLIMSPSPSYYHQKIVLRLSHLLEGYLEEHSIGELALAPSDVVMDGINVFQPDLYFVSADRLDLIAERGVRGAPDLVIEVLSRSNMTRDRKQKRVIYARSGVKEMWIIEPEKQTIEVHRLAKGLNAAPTFIRKPKAFKPAMFPNLEIDTTKLFKPVR